MSQIPTPKELDKDILKTKHKISLLNAHLLNLIEKRENDHEVEEEEELESASLSKLIEKLAGLILEAEKFKLNLQKLSEIHKQSLLPGGKSSTPIQEEGSLDKIDFTEMVTKRNRQVVPHPSSQTDSGINMDERLSRPDSSTSNRSLSTMSEPCESDDSHCAFTRKMSTRTARLLTTQAKNASSRRETKNESETFMSSGRSSSL
ncbi:uncharacterized protein LOC133190697 [Saccostrea echinata]|uniref:uncharacterized protein LOC133190697 n=1 Tax=Saccostrea echinata TaxID=191078 RepID=UPI002A8267C6|nr:uncharacterized protein LOC133190697 [Saccostrea echinata]